MFTQKKIDQSCVRGGKSEHEGENEILLTFCFRTSGQSRQDAGANVGILVSDGCKSCQGQFPLLQHLDLVGEGVPADGWPSAKPIE